MSDKKLLLEFLGYHKCATMWTNSIIRIVYHSLNCKFSNVDNLGRFERNLDTYAKDNTIDFLIYQC